MKLSNLKKMENTVNKRLYKLCVCFATETLSLFILKKFLLSV